MAARSVGIPGEYQEILEREHERLGFGTKVETIRAILGFYFENKDRPLAPLAKSSEPPAAPTAQIQPKERQVKRYYVIA